MSAKQRWGRCVWGHQTVAAAGRPAVGRAGGRRMIELQLLDRFEVRRDGDVVALPQSAQRLAAFLALHERPLQRIYVAGSLWLESTEEHANASLRSTLWRLGRQHCPLIEANGDASS